MKKDSQGITFDANLLTSLSLEEDVQLRQAYLDPTGSRADKFKNLNGDTSKNRYINMNSAAIVQALKTFEEVTNQNEKLLERGLNPNNPEDRKHFKELGGDTLGAVLAAFGVTF